MDTAEKAQKVREDRLRRIAGRRGFSLSKSRRRDPMCDDFGVYTLKDEKTGFQWGSGYRLTIDQVEKILDWSIVQRTAWIDVRRAVPTEEIAAAVFRLVPDATRSRTDAGLPHWRFRDRDVWLECESSESAPRIKGTVRGNYSIAVRDEPLNNAMDYAAIIESLLLEDVDVE